MPTTQHQSALLILVCCFGLSCSSGDSKGNRTNTVDDTTQPSSDAAGAGETSDDVATSKDTVGDIACPGEQLSLTYDTAYAPKGRDIKFTQIKSDVTWIKATTPNIIITPNAAHLRNQLFVFFPGSGAAPSVATKYLTIASFAGYHAIGLTFANDGSVSSLCKGSTNANCHGDVLQERIYGEDITDLVEIDTHNGIVGRLSLLLGSLHEKKPDEGWGQYLDSGKLVWKNIAVSGASQGGKVSTYISRDQTVARAVMFSAMGSVYKGSDGTPQLVPWSEEPRKTPAAQVYGLWHLDESANAYAPMLLKSYGVDKFGDIVDVDNAAPPYQCSHMLRMGYEPGLNNPDAKGNCSPHRSTGADDCTPLDDNGDPLLTPVYLHMLTHNETR